ncbi:SH2 domain-containing adapter protein F-like isoform X4 [Mobula hypostoma]|uniref:SH2 domain-containing adapter protein F-like isoform X4 n=1 Tax=Mobula hypostoma TaxID=723540 RepID=UPI002FC34E1A
MAKWFKEHLIFKSNKGPPQPPKPDYRLRSAGQPDILAAYKLQKERDFEDPYTGSRGCGAPAPGCGASSCPLPNPVKKGAAEVRYISPKHRLIKVENPEKNCGKSPGSPEDQQGKVIILEDYADPFDAQAGVTQAGQEKVVGNDGYMEPYEAQRMMAVEIKVIKELPWPPPVGQLDRALPDHEGDILPSHCHLVHQHPLPQTQPTLEDTSVQFDEADSTQQSPPKEEKVWHHNRLSGSNLKSLKQQSVELGEKVEADLPLVSQTWYHGAISRTDAENLLRLCKEASYLVRNSETTKNDYSLSLKSNQGFMHMKLTRTKESKYILGLNSPPFDSVPEVIHYYSSRKLPIKGAEHMSLLYPVAIRTL